MSKADEDLDNNVKKTMVFSYGSNSTKQISARVENPDLTSEAATLRGFVRVFSNFSPGWNGSVASLAPSKDPDALTLGAVVSLTSEELELLDKFEGGYRKVDIIVSVGHEVAKNMPALVYIAGTQNESSTTPFTLPMEVDPSEQYLWAIYGNLREHWTVNSLFIRSYADAHQGPIVLREWMIPENTSELSLEALCVEISLSKTEPWVMPRTMVDVVKKLGAVGINSTKELATAMLSPEVLNENLKLEGFEFSDETQSIIQRLMLPGE